MAEKFIREDIKIDDLLVSEENPRTFEAKDQNEAINFIVEDQRSKIVELAKSMAKGSQASSVLLVAKDETHPGKYRVYDGNRRLSVLRIAKDPSILWDEFSNEKEEMRQLSSNLQWNVFASAIFYDKRDAIAESKLIHSANSDGSGVEPWPPIRIARDTRDDKKPRYLNALLVVDELRDKKIFVDEEMKYYYSSKFAFTTLDRILKTKGALGLLNIHIDKKTKQLSYVGYEKVSLEAVKLIVTNLKKKGEEAWTRELNKKEKILDFVKKIMVEASRVPGAAGAGGATPSGGSGAAGAGGATPSGGSGAAGAGGATPGNFFKTINWDNKLDVQNENHVGLICVLEELRLMSGTSKIYAKYPIAAGAIMRTAYEHSMKLLLIVNKKWPPNGLSKLSSIEDVVKRGLNDATIPETSKMKVAFDSIYIGNQRNFLNNNIHDPGFIRATEQSLETKATDGMRGFIQCVIDRLPDLVPKP